MYEKIHPPEGRVVHKGSRLELRLVPVPIEGGVIEKEVVVHPGAAVILPILDDQRIVLIQNKRIAVGKNLWELPAGTLDPDEDPRACAFRELTEETGYRADRMDFLGELLVAPGWATYRIFIFIARDLTPGEQTLDPGENIKVVPITFSEVCSMIADSNIIDAKTITAIGLFVSKYGKFELTNKKLGQQDLIDKKDFST